MKASFLGFVFWSSFLFFSPNPALAIHVICPAAKVDVQTPKVAHIIGEVNLAGFLKYTGEVLSTLGVRGARVILINSPGGELTAGEGMIRTMEAEKSLGVRQICVVDRIAHSMAFDIFTHCDVRIAVPSAKLLMHKVADAYVDCVSARCTAIRLRELADDLETVDEPYAKANAKALGLPMPLYNLYADDDHVWTPAELLKLHYLQCIADGEK